jgi:hypothetical protein
MAILQVGKFKFKQKKKMDETLKPPSAKLQICKSKRMKALHCATSLTAEHVFCSSWKYHDINKQYQQTIMDTFKK